MNEPKISIFTPTHKPTYLLETYESLLSQDFKDWEWIVVPNHGAQIPDMGDPRVRIIRDAQLLPDPAIGYLKRLACSHAKAPIHLELDHDDLLREDALGIVYKAFEEGAEFVYTGFAEFNMPGWTPYMYNSAWGWEYKPFEWRGKHFMYSTGFPPLPPWILLITHGPNHIRSWTAKAYEEVGGHDVTMAGGDDYDLYVKLWVAGKRFKHIPECLYFYRRLEGGENSYLQRNQLIHQMVRERYPRYVLDACARWCRDTGLKAVDLGSLHGKPPGDCWVGVDRFPGPGVDVVADLNERWPFEDDSVGLIRAQDFVEHLRDPIHTMNEAWRVLAADGMMLIEVPSTDGRGAFQDPSHVSFWNEHSFWYYTQPQYRGFVQDIKAAFWPTRCITYFPSKWHEENRIPYVQAHLVAIKKNSAARPAYAPSIPRPE